MLMSQFLIHMSHITAYRAGYSQETVRHVTLLRILFLALQFLAASPCLVFGQGILWAVRGWENCLWAPLVPLMHSLGHLQPKSSPVLVCSLQLHKEEGNWLLKTSTGFT